MFILVVGAGRVGSTVATGAPADGPEAPVLDEDPLSHERLDNELDTSWEEAGGRFTVGAALESDPLAEAGITEADTVIVCTDGDNTNLVVAQIARRRYGIDGVIVRVLDPRRAEWYREQVLATICPTAGAIDMREQAVTALT